DNCLKTFSTDVAFAMGKSDGKTTPSFMTENSEPAGRDRRVSQRFRKEGFLSGASSSNWSAAPNVDLEWRKYSRIHWEALRSPPPVPTPLRAAASCASQFRRLSSRPFW